MFWLLHLFERPIEVCTVARWTAASTFICLKSLSDLEDVFTQEGFCDIESLEANWIVAEEITGVVLEIMNIF